MLSTTIIFIGILALMHVPFTLVTGLGRVKNKISLGDGGNDDMIKRIRAHGNFTENTPIALLAMAGAELAGLSQTFLMVGGVSLVLGRAFHYYSIRAGESKIFRPAGMVMTLSAIAFFGIAILVKSFA